jgi:hypothetical protein
VICLIGQSPIAFRPICVPDECYRIANLTHSVDYNCLADCVNANHFGPISASLLNFAPCAGGPKMFSNRKIFADRRYLRRAISFRALQRPAYFPLLASLYRNAEAVKFRFSTQDTRLVIDVRVQTCGLKLAWRFRARCGPGPSAPGRRWYCPSLSLCLGILDVIPFILASSSGGLLSAGVRLTQIHSELVTLRHRAPLFASNLKNTYCR